MTFSNSLKATQCLDAEDVLREYRAAFLIPPYQEGESIYFLGNSLGLQPKRTTIHINAVLKQWQQYGVEAFFKGNYPWLSYHNDLVKPLAEIVGALSNEVVVMNQLTVNLHLMLISFYRPEGRRTKIVCEAKAFPSDQYMLQTHLKHRGFSPDEHLIEVQPRAGEVVIHSEDIEKAIEEVGEDLALVLWGGVNYYTGQLFNMEAITTAAHQVGAQVGLDLAHAVGNVPLQLHNWNVDFACWCNYKYLNAGPGAVGAVFIHERHHSDTDLQRFAGWWGNKGETRFLMQKNFEPMSSAEGWALSTPSPLLFAALQASLELFREAGFEMVLQKSEKLSAFLFFMLHEVLKKFKSPPFQILTPELKNQRGSQVSILIPKGGKALFEYLTANGVYADWREPDVIRLAPVPLYNSFEDIWRFGNLLESGLKEKCKH